MSFASLFVAVPMLEYRFSGRQSCTRDHCAKSVPLILRSTPDSRNKTSRSCVRRLRKPSNYLFVCGNSTQSSVLQILAFSAISTASPQR